MAKAISFEKAVAADNPMTTEEVCSAERLLAHLVAIAYAADHPELFGDKRRDVHTMSGRSETPSPSLSREGNQGITTAGETYARIE